MKLISILIVINVIGVYLIYRIISRLEGDNITFIPNNSPFIKAVLIVMILCGIDLIYCTYNLIEGYNE